MKLVDVLEQYMIDCDNRGRVEGTLDLYRRYLGLLIRWLEPKGITDLEDVTLPILREFQSFLMKSDASDRYEKVVVQGKLTPVTISSYIRVIKAFLGWCYDEELISSNPSSRLKKPKVPEKVLSAFTPEQLEQFLGACDMSTRNGFRNYVIALVFLDTGMRLSELCNLHLSDIHPRYVKVDGKGQREREIGLHPNVSKLLWKYIQKYRGLYGIESDFVFLGQLGPLKIGGIHSIFNVLEEKSGVTGVRVSPHTLRHTFSKLYLKRGGDLFKLSRELGHSNVQTTGNIYLGDFKSTDAREDHDLHSPAGDIKIARVKDNKKGEKRKKRDK
jgi:integrase/recombinase XerD